jgi:SPP1 gp7 family putative phage head morphogenesis protein
MAATATAQAQRQPPPQQTQPQQPPSDHDLIALLIAAFVTYHTLAQILRALRAPFRLAGIAGRALQASIALVLSMPAPVLEGTGPATRWAVRANTTRRAAFSLATCRRVQAAIDAAKAHGEPVLPAIQDALKLERNYFSQHVAASYQRIKAGSAVDGMAAMHGNLLGWSTFIDANTTPGCKLANGKNFRVDDPPVVEGSPNFPGTVHAKCRCSPCPPRRGAPVMPGLGGKR